MTLTMSDADLATVRRRSGDTDEGGYELQDEDIDALYTSTSLGNSDLNRTTYYVILERYGLAVNEVAIGDPSTGFNTSKNQKFEQLEKLLALWGKIAGISAESLSSLTIGSLALGVDLTSADVTPTGWAY